MKEALESEFVAAVRRPECEVREWRASDAQTLTTSTMVFPFEYGIQGGVENERLVLRRLIYNEALLFHQENNQNEPSSPRQSRHRSFTMGAIPDHSVRSLSPQFHHRPGSVGCEE